MTYSLEFLEEAKKEWEKLNPAIRQQLKKKLVQILESPRISKKQLSGSANRYKIKLRSIGYHLVYEVIEQEVVVLVVAVGRRENNQVYKAADNRQP